MTFTVAKHSGDVEGVLIDKTLVPKLQPSTADNGKFMQVIFELEIFPSLIFVKYVD